MGAVQVAVAAVNAIKISFELLSLLHLTGPLWPPDRNIKNNSCFDYIIVGGGTAGCIVANRLTEDKNVSVLVLEAGSDPTIQTLIPLLFVTLPMTKDDWNYTSTFDDYAAQGQDNYTVLTAIKILGGSSSGSHFIEVRGSQKDYDSFAEIVGDPSWADVLPYFKKREILKDPEIAASRFARFHGTKGYTGVAREPREAADVYLQAFNETGSPVILDVNGDINIGYTQSMYTVTDGVRQSSAYSYIRPIRNRKNLYVETYTLATKILFENKRAVAVKAVKNNKEYIYRAAKEIILCAGVYNTPQLLMLSGIGHKEHLESFNIDVIADLPVGDNMKDQVAVSLVHKTAVSILPPPLPPLTEVPFPVIVGLAALNKSQTDADYQVFALVYAHDTPYILLTCGVIFPYRDDICNKFNNEAIGRNSLYSYLTMTKPKSSGTVRLRSTNPTDKPVITTNYYKDQRDLDNMVAYVKDYLKVGNSTYFKEVGAELIRLDLEECGKYDYGSDAYWRCYILQTTASAYHVTSTCAMGSVVDNKLRVYNVTNLRIVDASILPHSTSGGPNSAVGMIAEKASDIIKEDTGKEASCSNLNDNAKVKNRCKKRS